MTFKLFSRKSTRRDDGGAAFIVLLMMALVFAPIMALHAALLLQGPADLDQLAALMTGLLPRF
jgi:hypothetical protein